MVIVLEVQTGPSSGKIIRLPVGRSFRVGRGAESDIAFAKDAFMSGLHFSLECDSTTCSINDLNSRNGTLVNGERVHQTLLRDGDTIVAGCTLLEVRFYADDCAPPVEAGEKGMPANDSEVPAKYNPVTAEAERPDLAARARRNR
jgi:pSer/pThr/pTyr-binding forkhead associated (FHA) protein